MKSKLITGLAVMAAGIALTPNADAGIEFSISFGSPWPPPQIVVAPPHCSPPVVVTRPVPVCALPVVVAPAPVCAPVPVVVHPASGWSGWSGYHHRPGPPYGRAVGHYKHGRW